MPEDLEKKSKEGVLLLKSGLSATPVWDPLDVYTPEDAEEDSAVLKAVTGKEEYGKNKPCLRRPHGINT